MKTLFALTLAGACSAVHAQTPANNPMPDGSRDMYVGLGIVSSSKYEGADSARISLQPVLQAEWSNGLFVSGGQAGWHLSRQSSFEYGLLAGVQGRRSESGNTSGVLGTSLQSADAIYNASTSPSGGITVTDPGLVTGVPPTTGVPPITGDTTNKGNQAPVVRNANRLRGMEVVKARLQGGGFVNYYLAPDIRLTSSLLYGGGRERAGVLMHIGIQRTARSIAPHHSLSFGAGMNIVNGSYNNTFFGVTPSESLKSGNPVYQAHGGIKDIHATVRWNWSLSPSWMLASSAQVGSLQGSAKRSPLVERPTTYSVSTALAYRF